MQVRQGLGEMHGMLAGAAADLQHRAAVGEMQAQYGEDGIPVAFAGRGVGFVNGKVRVDAGRAMGL